MTDLTSAKTATSIEETRLKFSTPENIKICTTQMQEFFSCFINKLPVFEAIYKESGTFNEIPKDIKSSYDLDLNYFTPHHISGASEKLAQDLYNYEQTCGYKEHIGIDLDGNLVEPKSEYLNTPEGETIQYTYSNDGTANSCSFILGHELIEKIKANMLIGLFNKNGYNIDLVELPDHNFDLS